MHARPFGCAAGAGTITFDGTSLSIEDAWKIAAGEADVAIAPEAVKKSSVELTASVSEANYFFQKVKAAFPGLP